MSKHEVTSPMMHGGIIPQQWEHLLEENRRLKSRVAELENLILDFKQALDDTERDEG